MLSSRDPTRHSVERYSNHLEDVYEASFIDLATLTKDSSERCISWVNTLTLSLSQYCIKTVASSLHPTFDCIKLVVGQIENYESAQWKLLLHRYNSFTSQSMRNLKGEIDITYSSW